MDLSKHLFIDLEFHENKQMAKVMADTVRKIEEYRGRVGNRIYFQFTTTYDKLNFILSVTQMLKVQGYRTAFIKEIDPNLPNNQIHANKQGLFKKSDRKKYI
jgi:hypothetical protein